MSDLYRLPAHPYPGVTRNNAAATAIIPNGNTDRLAFASGLAASFSAAVAAIKTIIFYRGPAVATGLVSAPTLSRGSTDTAVASTAFEQRVSNAQSLIAAITTGTALAAGTIPSNKWGIYRLEVKQADGSLKTVAAAGSFTTGFATEALALAAVPAAETGYTAAGYLTVLTGSGVAFVGGTDALAGGSSGNPATTTSYYTDPTAAMPATSWFTLSWDFTNGPYNGPVPDDVEGNSGDSIAAVLAASGTGGITGSIVLFGRAHG